MKEIIILVIVVCLSGWIISLCYGPKTKGKARPINPMPIPIRKTSMSLLKQRFVFMGVIVFVVLGLVGRDTMLEEQRNWEHYCEMTKLYKDTHGKFGWPAYQGECNEPTDKSIPIELTTGK